MVPLHFYWRESYFIGVDFWGELQGVNCCHSNRRRKHTFVSYVNGVWGGWQRAYDANRVLSFFRDAT
jgi:hypothetical protein